MKALIRKMVFAGSLVFLCACYGDTGTLLVDLDQPIGEISPYIYGSNHDIKGFDFTLARRLGGNRLTGYNWEIDASNSGKDHRHQSDRWLAEQPFWNESSVKYPGSETIRHAGTLLDFHRESQKRGSYSLITVPMAGYVVADDKGQVSEAEAAPSERWVRVEAEGPNKAAEFLDDGVVYVNQMVWYLVEQLGGADRDGIRGYSLDNEPGLWAQTHPRIHVGNVSCGELLKKSVATAQAIKSVDPSAEVFGPALWGMSAFTGLQDAEDWKKLKAEGGYAWFIDAYLDHMSKASEKEGKRLLDVLDVHWYTQDPTGRQFIGAEAAHSARALYDVNHIEPNWVGTHFQRFQPLLPRLKQSIDQYYPGTRIAVSEYDWPMTGEVYGGLAQADALGAFGAHGIYFAAYHHRVNTKEDSYIAAAFNLYLNYDGRGAGFGVTSLPISLLTKQDVVGYASLAVDGSLHLILLNFEKNANATFSYEVPHKLDAASIQAWRFDSKGPEVVRDEEMLQVNGNKIKLTLDALSANHIVIPAMK